MNPGAQSLIAELDLHPHPAGGCYRKIFRSESRMPYLQVTQRLLHNLTMTTC